MHRSISILVLLFGYVLRLSAQGVISFDASNSSNGLVWDAVIKESTPKAGEQDIFYTFAVTNRSADVITIQRVETSCGCTLAEIPSEPWKLAPNEGGLIKVEFDARGKSGTIMKTLLVYTSVGAKSLLIKTHLPAAKPDARDNTDRVTNLMEASKNRQAVFQGKCVTCHVAPTISKTGKALYDTACGICHAAEHRASMVPDLKALKVGTPSAYWEHWIRNGKPNSLMPAFEQKQGGPLSDPQIQSLVEFISGSKEFPSNVTVPTDKKP
jgi:mono/diheme cytochrome c family protein